MFFQQQGKQFFLFVGKYPDGPTIQYKVQDYNTFDDVWFLGNSLLASRPILSFGKCFGDENMRKVEKNIWVDILNLPKNHPKSQPFIDKVISLDYQDGLLVFWVFQILKEDAKGDRLKLIETGPRMNLQPVRILSEFMFGSTLYKNPDYLTTREEKQIIK